MEGGCVCAIVCCWLCRPMREPQCLPHGFFIPPVTSLLLACPLCSALLFSSLSLSVCLSFSLCFFQGKNHSKKLRNFYAGSQQPPAIRIPEVLEAVSQTALSAGPNDSDTSRQVRPELSAVGQRNRTKKEEDGIACEQR